MLTKYLDLLPADARDRVLVASCWTTRAYVDAHGARNLLGHAEDWSWRPGQVPDCGDPNVFRLRESAGDQLWTDEPLIGLRFERLVRRRGLDNAIALIRARLARAESPPRIRTPRRGHIMLVL